MKLLGFNFHFLWPLLTAALVSAGAIAFLRFWAFDRGWVDKPTARGSHARPVPRMGGWGIAAGLGVGMAMGGHGHWGWRAPILILVFLLGAVDDRWHLSARVKFAALLALALAYTILVAPQWSVALLNSVWRPAPWLAGALAVAWLLTFTNFFNFMDGIDGMAGSSAMLYAAYFAMLALRSHGNPLFAFAIAGASVGFLGWNISGAVFMGDAGSLLLGFGLATAVLELHDPSAVAGALIGVAVTWFDPGFTLVRRLAQREPIFQAHRTHLYQRLLEHCSHLQVTAIYTGLTLVCMLNGWFYIHDAGWGRAFLLLTLLAILTTLVLAVDGRGILAVRPWFRRWLLTGIVLVISALLLAMSFTASVLLRFNLSPTHDEWVLFLHTAPLVISIRLVSLIPFRLVQGWWRYTTMAELADIIWASMAGGVVCLAVSRGLGPRFLIPSSVVLLDSILGVCLLGGARMGRRALFELRSPGRGKRTLIVGADEAGCALVREARRSQSLDLLPIAFVDDDPAKRGMWLFGLPVRGTSTELGSVCRALDIEQVVVTSDLSPPVLRGMIDSCDDLRICFRILPPLHHLLGTTGLAGIRDLQASDLLARDEIDIDLSEVGARLRDRVVMVTGGAGSIGSELARQLARVGCKRLVLLDRAESPLHDIGTELGETYQDLDVKLELVDMQSVPDVNSAFQRWRPDCVYHCAAYKHVPLLEPLVVPAVRNNVIGTHNILTAAHASGAQHFVLISTDKAVKPASIMGMTKRLCELMVVGAPADMTACAVRFGNVLGSNGSVVSTFLRQLAAGRRLTVTHPEMTRYFMTIAEAVQLVMQAGHIARSRDIFMLDMGERVRILDLAQNLRALHVQRGGSAAPVAITSIRPGEKLHEELHSADENAVRTEYPKIVRLTVDLNHGRRFAMLWPELVAAVQEQAEQKLLEICCQLVPEFREHWPAGRIHSATRAQSANA